MSVRQDDARERLLDAATQRFRRFGTRHTSVESITTAAGTGKGSLYLHYQSKEELYLATVRHAVDGFLEAAATAMHPDQPAPSRLRSLVEVAIAHYERDGLLAAPFLDDRELLDDRAATLARQLQRERVTDLIRTTLIDGQRAGTIRRDSTLPSPLQCCSRSAGRSSGATSPVSSPSLSETLCARSTTSSATGPDPDTERRFGRRR